MTKKISKEYLILGSVILLLIICIVFINLGKSCSAQSVPKIASIKKDDISKIVFTVPNNEPITLTKDKNSKWLIEPNKYPADKAAVDSMLGNIADLELVELISDKKIYDHYNLDDANKISVTGFVGDKAVLQYDIGKTTDIATFSFVKLNNNPNIYSAKGNIKVAFDKKILDLRDKKVMAIANREEITEFVLQDGTKTVHIKKQAQPKPDDKANDKNKKEESQQPAVWKSDLSDKPVADQVINDLFDGMMNLSCDDFVENKTKQELDTGKFFYKTTAKGAKDYVLTFVQKPENNKYLAISSESDYPFNVIGWKVQKLMRKIENNEIK
jgi:hypothetical protein